MAWPLPWVLGGAALLAALVSTAGRVRLSPHFSLAEFERTATGLYNRAPADVVLRMAGLCNLVLEDWRAESGPLRLTSGYRSFPVNQAVGGAAGSRHMTGEAADVRAPDQEAAFRALYNLWQDGVPVRVAILYHPAHGGHIHVDIDWNDAQGTARAGLGHFYRQTADGELDRWTP